MPDSRCRRSPVNPLEARQLSERLPECDKHFAFSSAACLFFRPTGAPTYQPRATPWESSPVGWASPERAAQGEAPLCFALSGLGLH